ncbi:unnamed protein product [Agarophyton chilense]
MLGSRSPRTHYLRLERGPKFAGHAKLDVSHDCRYQTWLFTIHVPELRFYLSKTFTPCPNGLGHQYSLFPAYSDVRERRYLILNYNLTFETVAFLFYQPVLTKRLEMDNESSLDRSSSYYDTANFSFQDPFERGKATLWDLEDDFFHGELDFFSGPAVEEDKQVGKRLVHEKTEPVEPVWPSLEDTDVDVPLTPNSSESMSYLLPTDDTCTIEQNLHNADALSSSDESVTIGSEGLSLELKVKDIQKRFMIQNMKERAPLQTSFKKEFQKPPTTAGITLEDLKEVFHLERPKAEKRLRLKRTTFSNLSRYYGISKWPFRTIRDALNRIKANEKMLNSKVLSREKIRKLKEQQRLLYGVIDLIYSDPKESKDTNTLAVLLRIVAARENPGKYSDM